MFISDIMLNYRIPISDLVLYITDRHLQSTKKVFTFLRCLTHFKKCIDDCMFVRAHNFDLLLRTSHPGVCETNLKVIDLTFR